VNKGDGGAAGIVIVECPGDRFEALHPARQIHRKTIPGGQNRFQALLSARRPLTNLILFKEWNVFREKRAGLV
jgi:hypothetical protein